MINAGKKTFLQPTFSLLLVGAFALILMSFGRKQSLPDLGLRPDVTVLQTVPGTAPVNFQIVTKVVMFGEIADPRTNKIRNHTGIDFELPAGSDILATADGSIALVGFNEKAGNFVVIRHDETYSTRYYHLQTVLAREGDQIEGGAVIGLVGNTGLSSIPHLHYEVLRNGKAVDPKGYLPALPSEGR